MNRSKHRWNIKTTIKPATILPESMAGYIAGIIDGEAYLSERKLLISNNSLYLLVKLQLVIGGHISTCGDRGSSFQLNLRAEERIALLRQILPYFIIKGKEAAECLRWAEEL